TRQSKKRHVASKKPQKPKKITADKLDDFASAEIIVRATSKARKENGNRPAGKKLPVTKEQLAGALEILQNTTSYIEVDEHGSLRIYGQTATTDLILNVIRLSLDSDTISDKEYLSSKKKPKKKKGKKNDFIKALENNDLQLISGAISKSKNSQEKPPASLSGSIDSEYQDWIEDIDEKVDTVAAAPKKIPYLFQQLKKQNARTYVPLNRDILGTVHSERLHQALVTLYKRLKKETIGVYDPLSDSTADILRKMKEENLSKENIEEVQNILKNDEKLTNESAQSIDNMKSVEKYSTLDHIMELNALYTAHTRNYYNLSQVVTNAAGSPDKAFADVDKSAVENDDNALNLDDNSDNTDEDFDVTIKKVVERGAMPKKALRAVEKGYLKYNEDYSKLTDLTAFSIKYGSLQEMADSLKTLKQKLAQNNQEIVFVKNRFVSGAKKEENAENNDPRLEGYSDILINVKDKNTGYVWELQLHLDSLLAKKKRVHKIYNKQRSLKEWRNYIKDLKQKGDEETTLAFKKADDAIKAADAKMNEIYVSENLKIANNKNNVAPLKEIQGASLISDEDISTFLGKQETKAFLNKNNFDQNLLDELKQKPGLLLAGGPYKLLLERFKNQPDEVLTLGNEIARAATSKSIASAYGAQYEKYKEDMDTAEAKLQTLTDLTNDVMDNLDSL
ncbi:MAG: hypothetical protein AAF551_04160, partial [Bacteroidota bacterium]